MAHPRRWADNDGRTIALRKVEGGLHHGEPLLDIGRIEHGNLRERRESARVLLGLRGYGAGVVSDEQHASPFDANIIQAHQRVACHVKANLLARKQRAGPRVRSARHDLERRFLVGRPFNVRALGRAVRHACGDGFYHFARRRARISRNNADARFKRCACKRLIAHEQLLRHENPR